MDAGALLAAALARDVGVYPLGLWRADPALETTAVVLGYGVLHAEAIAEGVRWLGEAVREVAG